MNTLNELQAQRQALEAKIAQELAASRAESIEQAQGLIDLHGLVARDFHWVTVRTASTRKQRADKGKPRGPRKPKPLAIAA